MGFGIGPKNAGSFYSVEQLEAFLATATQDDLLQERSATNCEVGFEFVNDYINNSERLKKAYVIYTSDGEANLDETHVDWSRWTDPELFDYYRNFSLEQVMTFFIGVEIDHIFAGNMPVSATVEMFPEECIAIEKAKISDGVGSDSHMAAIEALYNAMTANSEAYISCVLRHIHAVEGLTWGESYSNSDIEKAFQTYFRTYPGLEDSSYSSYMDFFYVLFGDMGHKKLVNRIQRAADASKTLQQNEKLVGLIHVGYSSANNTWMNPTKGYFDGFDTSKLTYIYNSQFADVTETLVDTSEKLMVTGYKDVTISDPMSKWVTLDESSIKIYNGDTLIYENGEWLTDDIPAENPITITTNEDGHRQIDWRVKDGWLLFNDRYYLRYNVLVNEDADGFEYGQAYPANDPTNVTYSDEDEQPHTNSVMVPTVTEEVPPNLFGEDDYGIQIYKQEKETKKPISDIVFDIYKVELQPGEYRNPKPTQEEIAKWAVAENLVDTITTDARGYAASKLEEGVYLLVERANEKVKAPVDPFYVLLPMQDSATGEYMNVVDVYPKNVPVETEPENPDTPKTSSFNIIKHDENDTSRVLKGAKFQILRLPEDGEIGEPFVFGDNGETINLVPVVDENMNPIIIETDENGRAVSPELPMGMYFLHEIKAPLGYQVSDRVIAVYAMPTAEGISAEPTMVPNKTGSLLPSTGGMGTTLFYLVGAVFVLGAGVILVTKRRMQYED